VYGAKSNNNNSFVEASAKFTYGNEITSIISSARLIALLYLPEIKFSSPTTNKSLLLLPGESVNRLIFISVVYNSFKINLQPITSLDETSPVMPKSLICLPWV